ncbi:hypothetical protein C8Q76DRAFT_607590, partial [Earliella scabrosa]
VITTPNQDWIPRCPLPSDPIRAYTDGTWGLHEYSRWPQFLAPDMWHAACIPRRPAEPHLARILWVLLDPERDWIDARTKGFGRVGFLSDTVQEQLVRAARHALACTDAIRDVPSHHRAYLRELSLVLYQCIERMRRLPAPSATAVSLGAHIQRLCLELLGLHTFLTVVLPRLQAQTDCTCEMLPVIGVFVRCAADAQTFARVGVPTWLRQPLGACPRIWRVVPMCSPTAFSLDGSPRILRPIGQIGNPQQDWVGSMVFAISRQLCDSHYPRLPSLCTDPDFKRAKMMIITPTLVLPSQLPRASRQSASATLPSSSAAHNPSTRRDDPVLVGPPTMHPSREHVASPFYRVPVVWASALRSLGRLPTPRHSVAYFYPPPFLLDTVCSAAPLPVPRYLHNLTRIRDYCRIRLLDSSFAGRPLTIAEWRAALWGDYCDKPEPLVRGSAGEQRRAKRKHHEKSAIGRLFGEDASLDSYSVSDIATMDSRPVTADMAATSPWVRMRHLWESHEINWRCEVMALDAVMVPRDDWSVVHRWAREAQVSAIWGQPSAMMSVLPMIPSELRTFAWRSPPDPSWTESRARLAAFVGIIARWEGCPVYLRRVIESDDDWSSEEYETIQTSAATFYCQTFVRHFQRLPIVPIQFPEHLLYS